MIDLLELRIYDFTIYTKNCNDFSMKRNIDKTVLVIKHEDPICTSDDSTNVNLDSFVNYQVVEGKSAQEIFVYDRNHNNGDFSIERNNNETLFIFKKSVVKPTIKKSFCKWVKTIFTM